MNVLCIRFAGEGREKSGKPLRERRVLVFFNAGRALCSLVGSRLFVDFFLCPSVFVGFLLLLFLCMRMICEWSCGGCGRGREIGAEG